MKDGSLDPRLSADFRPRSRVSPFFGRRDCEMTRWRPRGVVFKVRRVWGLWAVFCTLFFI